jgi:hypothetical protein
MHWLRNAANNHHLLVEQFSGPWLGMQDVKYYRPLMMSLMTVEYSLWGANGLGFRLVNLQCVLLTGLILGLISFELSAWEAGFARQPAQDFLNKEGDSKKRAHATPPHESFGYGLLARFLHWARMACSNPNIGSEYSDASSAVPPKDRSAVMAQPNNSKTRLVWPCISAALFALYPLHSESVNWIISQTDLLALLFFTLALWCHIRWRNTANRKFFIYAMAATTLSFLSKETAAILPVTIFGYELLRRHSKSIESLDRPWERRLPAGSVGAYNAPLQNPEPIGSPDDPDAWERRLPAAIVAAYNATLQTAGSIPIRLKEAFFATWQYWIILSGYLFIRRAALGTFVGGWDNSISFYASSQSLAHEWFHALRMTFVPVNASMLPPQSFPAVTWLITIILLAGGSMYAFTRSQSDIKLGIFLLGWFVLCLAPSYRFFMIDANLLNSRLAYFATAPLCLFLTYGLARLSAKGKWLLPAIVSAVLLLALCASILYSNNQAWQQSGKISNRIISSLRAIYQSTSDDPPTRIIGLPLVKDGVYICMNAIEAMTKKPFLNRDISNCKLLDNGDQLFPLGSLKDSITKSLSPVRFFYWDAAAETLKAIQFPAHDLTFANSWRAEKLKSIIMPGKRDPSSFLDWRSDGTLNVISMHRPVLEINVSGLPCWTTDFIGIKVTLSHTDKAHFSSQCDLFYTNNLIDKYFFREATHADLQCTNEPQELIFPLRGLADWSMGGNCKQLRLVLPSHTDIEISEIFIPPTEKLLPRLSFSDSSIAARSACASAGSADDADIWGRGRPVRTESRERQLPAGIGFSQRDCAEAYLSTSHPSQQLSYDAHLLPGCDHVILTIMKPNTFFNLLNSSNCTAEVTGNSIHSQIRCPSPAGQLTINLNSFPSKGLYKARLCAFDKNNQQVGVASDHILISVVR